MYFFFFFFFFVPMCSCMCLQVTFQVLERLDAALLGNISLCLHLLTFISCFVIICCPFEKLQFSTDDHHPLRSRSIYQNAVNCKTIHFRYITQRRVFFCARARNHVRPFTSRSSSMQSNKIMESSVDVFSYRNCSKARPHVSR